MTEPIFYLIAIGACVFALLTVTSRDVFHSAVWLSMTLLSVSAIYFYLQAEFLGVIQVLVYIGGIITLFVFAIKLTARIGDKTIKQVNQQAILSGIVALVFFLMIVKAISHNPWAVPGSVDSAPISLEQLGRLLLSTYALPFEFISVVLLATMVGAIVIGKVKK